MIFDAGALLGIVQALAAAERVPVPVSIATLREIVAQAEGLAGARVEDEPAALFYACACRARLFGKIADRFLDGVGGVQADRLGLKLDANELDLVLLRARIAFGAVEWNEVRETFARWIHPLGEPTRRAVAKRPRPR